MTAKPNYGCWNRKPYAAQQVLHGVSSATGEPVRTVVHNRMNPDCQYTKTELGKVDVRCAGCSWRGPV